MVEDKYKFYFIDRWFYLVKETDELLRYATNPSKITSGIILEKNNNNLDLFYYDNSKLVAKIYVSDINNSEIFIHYKDLVPQQNEINGEIYVNLLLNAFTMYKNNRKRNFDKFYVSKKKNLKKLCYREPDFLLDTTLDLCDFNVDSPSFNYYKIFADNFGLYVEKLKKCFVKEKSESCIEFDNKVKNLKLPDEIFLYDREYTLDKTKDNVILYTNYDDDLSELVMKYDYILNSLREIDITFKDDKNTKTRCEYKVVRNEYNGMDISFRNLVKSSLHVNQETIEAVLYNMYAKFDADSKPIEESLELMIDKKRLVLYPHPVLSNMYVDSEGNDYRVANGDFARLRNMYKFSNNVLSNLEKKLTLEK